MLFKIVQNVINIFGKKKIIFRSTDPENFQKVTRNTNFLKRYTKTVVNRPENFAHLTCWTKQFHSRTCLLKHSEQVLWNCLAISQQPVIQRQSMTSESTYTLDVWQFISIIV